MSITTGNQKLKNMMDLIVCELCAISVALIIDCIVFFDYFGSIVTPIVFMVILAAASIASIFIRKNLNIKLGFTTGKVYPEVKTGEVLLRVENLSQHFGSLKAVDNVSFDVKKGEVFGLVGESGCGKTTTGRTVIKLYNPTGGNVYFKGQRIGAGTLTYKQAIKNARAEAKAKIDALKAEGGHDDEIAQIKAELAKVVAENRKEIKSAKNDNANAERDLVTQIQMIFQDPVASLNPRMTVREIISEGLVIKGIKDKEYIDEKVYDILDKVGLVPEHAGRYPHEFSGGQKQRVGIARSVVMRPEMIIADEPVSALDVSVQAQVINLLNEL